MSEPAFHPALVDKTAKAIRDCCDDPDCWDDATEPSKNYYRSQARRALAITATWKGPVFEPPSIQDTVWET